MIDLIPRVKKLLESTGITVKYGTEFHFNAVPVITFRKVTTDEGFHADNAEQSQVSKFAVDICSRTAGQGRTIAMCPGKALMNYIICRRDIKKRYFFKMRGDNGNQY